MPPSLRRKPKTLDGDPLVFDATGSGAGAVLRAKPGRAGAGRARPSGPGADFTEDEGEIVLPDELQAVDAEVRARARAIAARLAVPRPRAERSSRRGAGTPVSVPYRGGSDDLDLDRTLEVLAELPAPEDEDLIVRERVRAPRAVVLVVDVSGSMRGERVRTAAAAVGALAGELATDALSVIAFWSDAAQVLRLRDPIRPMEVLDNLLRIPARGLTNIAFPLQLAAQQLAGEPARDARVLLLSDCVHNAGPDPRPFAARLPRLDVLLDASGEKDVELGRQLAELGRGAFRAVRRHLDVAPALSEIFRT